MTTIWFLVTLTFAGDQAFMQNMPVVKDSYEHCMQDDYYMTDRKQMVCVEADDFADLIQILLNNFDFGGQPT